MLDHALDPLVFPCTVGDHNFCNRFHKSVGDVTLKGEWKNEEFLFLKCVKRSTEFPLRGTPMLPGLTPKDLAKSVTLRAALHTAVLLVCRMATTFLVPPCVATAQGRV